MLLSTPNWCVICLEREKSKLFLSEIYLKFLLKAMNPRQNAGKFTGRIRL